MSPREEWAIACGVAFFWIIILYLGALNDQAALDALR